MLKMLDNTISSVKMLLIFRNAHHEQLDLDQLYMQGSEKVSVKLILINLKIFMLVTFTKFLLR